MAEEKDIAARKQELVNRLAANRVSISESRAVIKEKLQVKKQFSKQFRKLVSRKPKALFVGSAAAGLAATLLLRRGKKSSSKPKTVKGILLTWGLSLLKPAAKKWLTKRVKNYAINRFSAPRHPQQPHLEETSTEIHR